MYDETDIGAEERASRSDGEATNGNPDRGVLSRRSAIGAFVGAGGLALGVPAFGGRVSAQEPLNPSVGTGVDFGAVPYGESVTQGFVLDKSSIPVGAGGDISVEIRNVRIEETATSFGSYTASGFPDEPFVLGPGEDVPYSITFSPEREPEQPTLCSRGATFRLAYVPLSGPIEGIELDSYGYRLDGTTGEAGDPTCPIDDAPPSDGPVDPGEPVGVEGFQVDFVGGGVNEILGESEDDFYSRQNRLVRFVNGTFDDGITERGSPGTLGDDLRTTVESEPISIDRSENTTSVSFDVVGEDEVELTLASYTLPGGDFDAATAERQFLVDFDTGTFAPGEYTRTVALPDDPSE
jgi:hypothetical protein